jgi:hypothetical protein
MFDPADGSLEYIYMHSHVSNTPASTEDYQALHNLDQSQQTIITDEGVFKIRKVQANEQGKYITPEGETLEPNPEANEPVVVMSGGGPSEPAFK